MQHILGNLLAETYEEIMRGKALQEIRKQMEAEESAILCRKCVRAVPLLDED